MRGIGPRRFEIPRCAILHPGLDSSGGQVLARQAGMAGGAESVTG